MVLGVAVELALEVAPTVPTGVVATGVSGVDGVVTATVALTYGALDAAQVLQYTTLEVVTGLTIVQGQLVMVKMVDSVAV